MALISVGDNIATVYRQVLLDVMTFGQETHPRGFNCKELSPYIIELHHPENNILSDSVRKINKAFAAAEFLWMFHGKNDVEYISRFNSKITEYSDDGKIFYGAYGPKIIDQLPYVEKTLKEDPWTRQAILTIWRENPPKSKDIPCTIMLHFIRRPIDTLNLIVYMRSNDIWLGLPYDIHNFTCIQMTIANKLKLQLGSYTHVDGSLHAYEKDYEKIHRCISNLKNTDYEETKVPVICNKYLVTEDYLRRKNEQHNH